MASWRVRFVATRTPVSCRFVEDLDTSREFAAAGYRSIGMPS